jgi:hypothetical protein
MALETKIGPLAIVGNSSPIQNTNWDAGPSVFMDGTGVVDDRFLSGVGNSSPPRVYALNSSDLIAAIDAFPAAASATNVVNAVGAGTTVGNTLTLATGTVQASVANIPMVPWTLTTDVYGNRQYVPAAYSSANQGGTTVTAPLTFDFGMCAGTTFTSTTVALSSTTGAGYGTIPVNFAGQTVNKNQIIQLNTTGHIQPELMFVPGQYIIVANAGNAAGTIPLITQVLAIDYINHFLYVANAAQSAVTNGGIGNANPYGSTPGVAYWPFQSDGSTILFDPRQGLSRTLTYVSSSASDTAATLTVKGLDVYGIPLTETITLTGTAAVAGKKAFKAVLSVTVGGATLVGNVSVGTTLTLGLNIRADAFSYLEVFYNDANVAANTGFTKGDISVATAATGDVRGTYTLQSGPTGGPPTTSRVAIWVNPSQYAWSVSTNLVPQPIFGMTQF